MLTTSVSLKAHVSILCVQARRQRREREILKASSQRAPELGLRRAEEVSNLVIQLVSDLDERSYAE